MRVAGAPAPDALVILSRGDERRHGVHVGGKHDIGLAPVDVNIVTLGNDRHQLDLAVVFLGQRTQVLVQIVADLELVRRDRVDINQRPC